MSRISDFIVYLNAQVGSAYVWGAQGHLVDFSTGKVTRNGKLVSSDYTKWVRKVETSSINAERALSFIAKRKATGIKELYCYDCSGLSAYYFLDQKKWIPKDMNAASFYAACTKITRVDLRPGDMVFRADVDNDIHHIGYVTKVENGNITVIESFGRDLGVVSRDINASGAEYWNRYGRFPVLQEPEPERPDAPFYATCIGGKVNIRSGASLTNSIVGQAAKDELLLAMPPKDGWCAVVAFIKGKPVIGYMSEKYISQVR